jgi:hypothetical protein
VDARHACRAGLLLEIETMTHARQDDASHRGQRGRRAWAALTLACAGVGAGVAFIHGAFLGSAHSEATVSPQPSFQSPRIGVEGTLHVPGSYPTIQAAIDAAADGATIVVAPGVYTERLSLDGRSLVIWGVGGAEVTAIAGDTGRGPIVSLRGGMNRLEGLTLQGGRGETGRGVAVHDGAAVFADCRFRDNAGGVQASGSSLTFARCQFRDNRADFAGGALLLQGGHARLEHCRMESNVARTFGGGVSVMDGQVDLIDTFVTDNRLASGAWGGGIYASNAQLTVEGGAFLANASAESGSAAFLRGGTGVFRGVQFRDNTTAPEGWAVHAQDAAVSLQDQAWREVPSTRSLGFVGHPPMEHGEPLAMHHGELPDATLPPLEFGGH